MINDIDLVISNGVQEILNPVLNKIMMLVSLIANTGSLIFLSIIVFVFLFYKKRTKEAFVFVFGVGGGALIVEFLKQIIGRARPENSLILASGYSFPSGHALNSIVFFLLVAYFFKNNVKDKILKRIFLIACIVLPLIIGFSRIYLNVHWMSDVIAGFAIGVIWFGTVVLLSGKIKKLFLKCGDY